MSIRLATYYHAKDVPELPGSNIFHSTELFHVLEQTKGYCPRLLVAYEGEIPVGKLLCILRRSARLSCFMEKGYAYGVGEYFPLPTEEKRFFGSCCRISPFNLLNGLLCWSFVIWKNPCLVIVIFDGTVISLSVGYGYAILFIMTPWTNG